MMKPHHFKIIFFSGMSCTWYDFSMISIFLVLVVQTVLVSAVLTLQINNGLAKWGNEKLLEYN